MALLSCDFFSDALQMSTSMTVVLPQATESQIGMTGTAARPGGCPVLYLLHGMSDDHTTWPRRTSVERYVASLGIAVVMPAVHRSFYADEAHGHRYWTFLSQELPVVVSSFFRVSERREDTFVAGLSMGGYGALKWALREPGRFAAAASMSGALDVEEVARDPERRELSERIFDGVPGPEDDLFTLLRELPADRLPSMHISCGSEDPLCDSSRRFAEAARAAGARVETDFRPGEHEWGFWDEEIQKVLAWLPLDSHA